jgi:hypothetical protein
MGRIFKSPKSGHLLNMHYLHEMFPLKKIITTLPSGKKQTTFQADDYSEFMEMDVTSDPKSPDEREDWIQSLFGTGMELEDEQAWVGDVNTPISPLTLNSARSTDSPSEIDGVLEGRRRVAGPSKVKHFSRLWMYRNGASPPPDRDLIPTRKTL